jgi:hypothetical protein
LTPEDTIRELLLSFNDARDPLLSRNSRGSGETGMQSLPGEWYSGSYRPLETALKEMRTLGHERYSGVRLAELWWHLSRRYLMAERKVIWKVGARDVEEIAGKRRCICGHPFWNRAKARKHIEKAHGPKAELVMIYPTEYQRVLQDTPLRAELCELLAVRWLVKWFSERAFSLRLPRTDKEAA